MDETIKDNESVIETPEKPENQDGIHAQSPEEADIKAEPIEDTDEKNDEIPATDYAALEEEDLNTIRLLFPECRNIGSVTELDNPLRYAALRDLGLSVKEAFLATQRRQLRYDNRAHLKSTVPSAAGGEGVSMSAEDLRQARELFSGLSDSQIQKLYKSVIK